MFFLCFLAASTFPTSAIFHSSVGKPTPCLILGSNVASLVLFRISVTSLSCRKSALRLSLLLFTLLLVLLLWSLQKNPGSFHNILRNTEDLPPDLLGELNLTQNKTGEAPETSGLQPTAPPTAPPLAE